MNKRTVILIHEIYGVTESLLKLKGKLEAGGFSVIVPTLYEDRYTGYDERKSYEKFYAETGIEKGFKIVDKLIAANAGSEINLIGFSVGATIAWMHSSGKRISTVTGFYGSRIRNHLHVTPAVKTHLFFCREKSFDVVPVIEELNKKKNVEAILIDGEHGFYSFPERTGESLIKMTDERIFKILGVL